MKIKYFNQINSLVEFSGFIMSLFRCISNSSLLDFDKDDTSDLRLLVAMYGSPGMGIHDIAELQSLNAGTILCGTTTADTIFLYRKTNVYYDDYNIYKVTEDHYSCRRESGDYQVLSSETDFHVLGMEFGDKLGVNDHFSEDTVSFIYNWSTPPCSDFENDTVRISSSYSRFDCHSFPYGEEIYLGFKLIGDPTRLGWIKLILESENKMALKEYAIQE